MGLIHPVTLHVDGGARLRYPGATVVALDADAGNDVDGSGGRIGGGSRAGTSGGSTSTSGATSSAGLQLMVQVENGAASSLDAVVVAHLSLGPNPSDAVECRVPVALVAGETLDLAIGSNDCSGLAVERSTAAEVRALLWWPWQMGQPNVQSLNMSLVQTAASSASAAASSASSASAGDDDDDGGAAEVVLDALSASVGFAKVDAPLDGNDHRYFVVNNQRLLIRGGGYVRKSILRLHSVLSMQLQLTESVRTRCACEALAPPRPLAVRFLSNDERLASVHRGPSRAESRSISRSISRSVRARRYAEDVLLRASPERFAAEMAHVRNLGLNTVRLEGRFPDASLFDAMTALGVLALPGVSCCDAWQVHETAVETAVLVGQVLVPNSVKIPRWKCYESAAKAAEQKAGPALSPPPFSNQTVPRHTRARAPLELGAVASRERPHQRGLHRGPAAAAAAARGHGRLLPLQRRAAAQVRGLQPILLQACTRRLHLGAEPLRCTPCS